AYRSKRSVYSQPQSDCVRHTFEADVADPQKDVPEIIEWHQSKPLVDRITVFKIENQKRISTYRSKRRQFIRIRWFKDFLRTGLVIPETSQRRCSPRKEALADGQQCLVEVDLPIAVPIGRVVLGSQSHASRKEERRIRQSPRSPTERLRTLEGS